MMMMRTVAMVMVMTMRVVFIESGRGGSVGFIVHWFDGIFLFEWRRLENGRRSVGGRIDRKESLYLKDARVACCDLETRLVSFRAIKISILVVYLSIEQR